MMKRTIVKIQVTIEMVVEVRSSDFRITSHSHHPSMLFIHTAVILTSRINDYWPCLPMPLSPTQKMISSHFSPSFRIHKLNPSPPYVFIHSILLVISMIVIITFITLHFIDNFHFTTSLIITSNSCPFFSIAVNNFSQTISLSSCS